jgi:hypothetical protein
MLSPCGASSSSHDTNLPHTGLKRRALPTAVIVIICSLLGSLFQWLKRMALSHHLVLILALLF